MKMGKTRGHHEAICEKDACQDLDFQTQKSIRSCGLLLPPSLREVAEGESSGVCRQRTDRSA